MKEAKYKLTLQLDEVKQILEESFRGALRGKEIVLQPNSILNELEVWLGREARKPFAAVFVSQCTLEDLVFLRIIFDDAYKAKLWHHALPPGHRSFRQLRW